MEDILEEKLNRLYKECINDLKSIGLDIKAKKCDVGEIDIGISKRNNKRYGCCRQEEPDLNYKHTEKKGYKRIIKYEKFNKHHIEISRWVLELDDNIIKNTIIHEIIHCFPYCNNHGEKFKEYANIINNNLGYKISRVGNKEEDYKRSGIKINMPEEDFNYKIICTKCGQEFYRKRLKRNLIKKYRCGICNGKLISVELCHKK